MKLIEQDRNVIKKEFIKFLERRGLYEAFLQGIHRHSFKDLYDIKSLLDKEHPTGWVNSFHWEKSSHEIKDRYWTNVDDDWEDLLEKEYKKSKPIYKL